MISRRSFTQSVVLAVGGAWAARASTIHERILEMSDRAPLRMRFTGSTLPEFQEWQSQFGSKLSSLLGDHIDPPKEWSVEVENTMELSDQVRQHLILSSPGYPDLPLYLLTPKKRSLRSGVVALHGHGAGSDVPAGRDDLPAIAEEISLLNGDYGRQLAREGFVVAVPCLTPFGRRLGDIAAYGDPYLGRQDPCAISFVRLQLLGRVLMAENLRDVRWAISFLEARDDVRHIGVAGLSYGGRMTMLSAAMDTRVKAAVISGAMNVMRERIRAYYSCGAQVIPNLLEYGDTPEIMSLIAPRALQCQLGVSDSLQPLPWREDARAVVCSAFDAANARDLLSFVYHPGGHQWQSSGSEFLKKHLT